MQIQLYRIMTHSNQRTLDEMNIFLRSHEIIDLKQELITNDGEAYWTVFIRYMEGQNLGKGQVGKDRVDYKEKLDETSMTKF